MKGRRRRRAAEAGEYHALLRTGRRVVAYRGQAWRRTGGLMANLCMVHCSCTASISSYLDASSSGHEARGAARRAHISSHLLPAQQQPLGVESYHLGARRHKGSLCLMVAYGAGKICLNLCTHALKEQHGCKQLNEKEEGKNHGQEEKEARNARMPARAHRAHKDEIHFCVRIVGLASWRAICRNRHACGGKTCSCTALLPASSWLCFSVRATAAYITALPAHKSVLASKHSSAYTSL